MEIGKKICKILKEKNIKQVELIKFLLGKDEISSTERTRFSRYFNDIHEIPNEYLFRISQFLEVDILEIISNQKLTRVPSKIVPVLGYSSCSSIPSESYFKDHYDETDETTYYSGDAEKVYALKAYGDSMEDYIYQDDICFFEITKNNNIKDGEVVHYSFDYGSEHQDKNGIKVYKQRKDGSIYLKPLNGKHSEIDIEKDDLDFLRLSRLLYIQKPAKKF